MPPELGRAGRWGPVHRAGDSPPEVSGASLGTSSRGPLGVGVRPVSLCLHRVPGPGTRTPCARAHAMPGASPSPAFFQTR